LRTNNKLDPQVASTPRIYTPATLVAGKCCHQFTIHAILRSQKGWFKKNQYSGERVRKVIRQAASLGQILLAIIERLPL